MIRGGFFSERTTTAPAGASEPRAVTVGARQHDDIRRSDDVVGEQGRARRAVQDDDVVFAGERPEHHREAPGGVLGLVERVLEVAVALVGRQHVEVLVPRSRERPGRSSSCPRTSASAPPLSLGLTSRSQVEAAWGSRSHRSTR